LGVRRERQGDAKSFSHRNTGESDVCGALGTHPSEYREAKSLINGKTEKMGKRERARELEIFPPTPSNF